MRVALAAALLAAGYALAVLAGVLPYAVVAGDRVSLAGCSSIGVYARFLDRARLAWLAGLAVSLPGLSVAARLLARGRPTEWDVAAAASSIPFLALLPLTARLPGTVEAVLARGLAATWETGAAPLAGYYLARTPIPAVLAAAGTLILARVHFSRKR